MNKSKLNRDFFKTAFILTLFILSACGTSNVEVSTATLPVPTTKTPAPTLTPSPTVTPAFEGFGLSTELVKALKAHTGLESSINKEVAGQYSVIVSLFSSDGQPVTQSMYVIPSTLSEDLESKNRFGNTPTMQTVDEKTLYWVQEEQGWFAVEISTDINRPVFVPFEERIVVTRAVIAAFNEPFSQKALENYQQTAHKSNLLLNYYENKAGAARMAAFRLDAMGSSDMTTEGQTMKPIDAWFVTSIPDPANPQNELKFEYFYTKLLNSAVSPDEWVVVQNASGQELMGDQPTREKFEQNLFAQPNGRPFAVSVPIIFTDHGFFDNYFGFITFSTPQPSLEQLLNVPGNNPLDFYFFNDPYTHAVNAGWGPQNKTLQWSYDQTIPADIQTYLFPALLIQR